MKKKEKQNIDAQLRLAEIMNNTPRKIKLGDRIFSITALKPGTQYLIAQEAAKIAKTSESLSDIIKEFAENVPAVIRCLALAILNDKKKIEDTEGEYRALCEFIEWETNPAQWLSVLVEVLQLLDLNFFFQISTQIDLFRQMTLMKKEKIEAS
jgi:hypothetical protein